jgi:hypothetical protein
LAWTSSIQGTMAAITNIDGFGGSYEGELDAPAKIRSFEFIHPWVSQVR